MDALALAASIALIMLCYSFGKAEILRAQLRRELALLALLPEEERIRLVREKLDQARITS